VTGLLRIGSGLTDDKKSTSAEPSMFIVLVYLSYYYLMLLAIIDTSDVAFLFAKLAFSDLAS